MQINGYTVRQQDFVHSCLPKEPARILLTIPHTPMLSRADAAFLFTPRARGIITDDDNVTAISSAVQRQLRVGAIRGMLPREFIDLNRATSNAQRESLGIRDKALAYADPSLEVVYTRYHGAITEEVRRMIQHHGASKCLVLDLHGFFKQPSYAPEGGFDVILGTLYRQSIPHGNPDHDLAGFLGQAGFRVFCPETTPTREGRGDLFSGGFTCAHHAQQQTINVIQIEFAPALRGGDPAKTQTCIEVLNHFIGTYNN